MNVRRVDPARSRIMLVGVDAYTDSSIPDEPAIANNITDFAAVLTDPALGGFDPEHLLVAPPGAGVDQVGNLLVAAAAEAEDLLLFYYAGHGFPTSRRAELHLSLAGTRVDQLAFTALPFDAVRDAFLDSGAGSRMVILDCCYSGKAIGQTLGDSGIDVMAQLDVAGTYTLTASPATRPAKAALPGERHTAFTGRLLELLRSGTPQAGPDLSLGDIYRHLRARLNADGLPLPQQRGTENGDLLALTPNPAYRKPVRRLVVQSVPLPGDLRTALASGYPRIRAAAVTELAEWLDDADLRRVRAAQRELQKIAATDRPEVADVALAALRHRFDATAVLAVPDDTGDSDGTGDTDGTDGTDGTDDTDDSVDAVEIAEPAKAAKTLARRPSPVPDRAVDTAELLARQIAAAPSKAETLAQVAKAAAVNDRGRAAELIEEAEAAAAAIEDETVKGYALADIAQAAAWIDPGHAEAVAYAVTDPRAQAWALILVVEATAAGDPQRAGVIAHSIGDASLKARALAKSAEALTASDPDEAETLAHTIGDESWKARALAMVAEAAFAADPDRAARLVGEAERIGHAITDSSAKAWVLTEIAMVRLRLAA